MNRGSLGWLLVIALVLIGSVVSLLRPMPQSPSRTAVIWSDRGIQETIDLSAVEAPYTKTFRTPEGGYNVIEVRPNEIAIREANCPDQACVRQGTLQGGGRPLVCLPHHLVIQLEGPAPEDGDPEALTPAHPDAISS